MKVKLTPELRDTIYMSDEKTITGHGRWDVSYESIINWEGNTYLVKWSVGATEQQDYDSFDYSEEVELIPVAQQEVTQVKWVPVE